MSEDARRHYEAVERVVRAADEVVRETGEQVLGVLRKYGSGPFTASERAAIMREVDRIIVTAFGTRGGRIEQSALYRVIRRESARVYAGMYKRTLDDLDDTMKRYAWWPEQKAYWLNAPVTAVQMDQLAIAYRMVYGPHVERERILNARLFQPQRTWVDPQGYRLSDRIWRQGQGYRNAIDRTIQKGIQQGWSAERLATELRQYVDPEYAPVRYTKSGRVYRTGSTYRPNAASAARRLARTEITRVHGEGAKDRARDTPGVLGMRWRLSLQHPRIDRCDDHANADQHGLGKGVYPVDEAPDYPDHPNCMCTLVPVHKSREETRREIVDKYRGIAFEEAGFDPETGWQW